MKQKREEKVIANIQERINGEIDLLLWRKHKLERGKAKREAKGVRRGKE
jgi:hypothetical protein